MVYMCHTVVKLSEFATVPTVGRAHQVSSDALQFVDVLGTTFWTNFKIVISIFITTINATVSVVIDRAIAHVILVHHIHNTHDDLWVMSGITIYFHVEDMAATCQVVIWSLYFSLVACRALVIDRHVVGVGVVVTVGDTRNYAEFLAVFFGKLASQSLCRSGKHGIIVMVTL